MTEILVLCPFGLDPGLLSKAVELSGGDVRILVPGQDARAAAAFGAGKIHTLDIGDTIMLTTKLGTRSYEVYAAYKVSVDDMSVLNDSAENIVTLVTCVRDQPSCRWIVQARAKI